MNSAIPKTQKIQNLKQFEKLPGVRLLKPQRLWNQAYGKVRRVQLASGNVREIVVEYDRTVGFVERYRITIIPRRDRVEFGDLQSVLTVVRTFKFSIIEFAIDFPIRSVLDLQYVQRHGLFGKMQPRFIGVNPLHDTRGSRRGGIFQRVYARFETDALRMEFEFHARFLRQHRINTLKDLRRVAQIVRDRLIFFGDLDEQKLDEQLRRNGLSERRRRNIREQVRDKAEDLSAVMRYLRRREHLTNARRLLVPLPVNRTVREALEKWSTRWTATPARWGAQGS
jgi:hypothetical protein